MRALQSLEAHFEVGQSLGFSSLNNL